MTGLLKKVSSIDASKGLVVLGWTMGHVQKITIHALERTCRWTPPFLFGGIMPRRMVGNLCWSMVLVTMPECVRNVHKVGTPTRLPHFLRHDLRTIISVAELIVINFSKETSFWTWHGRKAIVRVIFHALLPRRVLGPPIIGIQSPRETKGFVARKFGVRFESLLFDSNGGRDYVLAAT